MKLVAWDTSSRSGALAALEWKDEPGARPKLVSEWTLNVGVTHSERLLWGVNELLESASWSLGEVDLFGVGVGPGSFTGLRIGVTTARTLAHATGKPLVGISSLAALVRPAAVALQARTNKEKVVVIGATDACKGELFAIWGTARNVLDCSAMADGDFSGLWKRGVEEQVITPECLLRSIQKKVKDASGWVLVGEAKSRYPEVWKKLPASKEISSPFPFPDQVQGRYVGILAWEAFQVGLAREALQVHPRYLRASDAELKLRAGLLSMGPK